MGKSSGGFSLKLLDVAEAKTRLLEYFSPLEGIKTQLEHTTGRVLAREIVAEIDLPPFPNSAMDGFALRVTDVADADSEYPAILDVVADVPAGKVVELNLGSGQAARIMTGAVIPPGTEAVVPVEDTDFNYRQPGIAVPKQVKVFRSAKNGESIRLSGEDVRRGETVMYPGSRIRAQDIGFLSMLGMASVYVHRLPRVAIFSTGDELLPVDIPLEPGKIHDANTNTLVALVEQYGGEPINLGIIPDRAEDVLFCLNRAVAENADLIISSAGVSVGAFDFVRNVVEQMGHLDFWRVNMRPGKPIAFGEYREIPFIGLPGNPVSAFVGFEVFVRPALLKMAGERDLSHPVRSARLLDAVESDGRESYLRAIVSHQDGEMVVRLTGHQGSGNLRSLVQANALMLVPSGVKLLPNGAEASVWLFEDVR